MLADKLPFHTKSPSMEDKTALLEGLLSIFDPPGTLLLNQVSPRRARRVYASLGTLQTDFDAVKHDQQLVDFDALRASFT